MHRSLLAFALSVCAGAPAAHATTITAGTYTLQNASVSGYAVTGTVTFNSSGAATAANLVLNAPEFGNPAFTSLSSTGVSNGASQSLFTTADGFAQLELNLNTLADNHGFYNLCLSSAPCGSMVPGTGQSYGSYAGSVAAGISPVLFTSGYLQSSSGSTPVAATPEPCSLLLLGTGIVGLGGAALRSPRRSGLFGLAYAEPARG